MSLLLSDRCHLIKPSATLAVSQKAHELQAQGIDIISLAVGEPDFPTPEPVKMAAIAAIQANHTHYTNVDGIDELKQAIVTKFARENQLSFTVDEVIVSTGAKQSIYNALQALLNPGDEVIIPAPYWVSYPEMVLMSDAKPVFINTDMQQQFKITPTQLKNSITPKTRLCFLNSPSNPTGVEYNANELKALGDVFKQHPNIIILCDDIYEHLRWSDTPFVTLLNVCPELKERTIIVNGVSKAYAMTGWRIGYAAASATLCKAMKKIQSQCTSNPCSIAQYAAVAALNSGLEHVKPMVKAFEKRATLFFNALSEIPHVNCLPITASFYAFPNVKKIIQQKQLKDDIALANYLLEHAHVAVVPGTPFGLPDHIRLSIATSESQLKIALERLQAALSLC